MRIGVLALQGDVEEHCRKIKECKAEPVLVRSDSELKSVSGLIIPGGESTTIGLLLKKSGLDKKIIERAKKGLAIYGTCAGAILIAKVIIGSKQPRLGLLDITIRRNDYGRQIDSFEADIEIKGFNHKLRAIFIRSPVIEKVNNTQVLSTFNNKPVLVRNGNILISTFHPELTTDKRIHNYFIREVQNHLAL